MKHELCSISGCYNFGKYCRLHASIKPLNQIVIVKTVISKVSEPRKDENKIYEKEKKKYLKAHPFCEAKLTGCTKIATEIHHKRKRRTHDDRVNPKNFLSACHSCHVLIEANPEMSFKNKLSEKAIN